MSKEKVSPSRKLPLWKKRLFAVVMVALVCTLVEVVLWVFGVRPVIWDEDPYVGFSSIPLFLERTTATGERVMVTAPNKGRFFNRQQFPREKADRTRRIFCLGGSTTYGRPYGDETSFSGWLRAFLPAADPGQRWEVINAGGVSYASYRVASLMQELVGYAPDVFIIYCGHNEFLEQRTYAGILETPGLIRQIGAVASHSRIYALLRRALVKATPATPTDRPVLENEVATLLDKSVGPSDYHRDDAWQKGVLEHYRFSLERMVELGRSVGATTILVTPASNLRDCSPFKSQPRDELGRNPMKTCSGLIDQSRKAIAQGRLADALAAVARAVAIDDRHAGFHFMRGRILHTMKRYPEAKEAFRRARDEDVCPLRALSRVREIVRDVAGTSGAPLVDFVATVDARAEAGIPGADLFLDHVHLTIAGHRMLALELLDLMTSEGLLERSAGWGEAATAQITKRVEGSVDARAQGRALTNLAKVLGWAGKTDEAARLALKAVQLVPDNAETHYELGVSLSRGGDLSRAAHHYELAIKNNPGFIQAYSNLGVVYRSQGKVGKAVSALRAGLARAPRDLGLLCNLGGTLAATGKLREAKTLFERALAVKPGFPQARAGLKWVSQRLK